MKGINRSPNVRISPRAHELLRQLAEEEQQSMQSILDRALERYRRGKFFVGAQRRFRSTPMSPKGMEGRTPRKKLWEQTLADGLAKE
jgi:hypothetical protein